jgi:hypothetical protein
MAVHPMRFPLELAFPYKISDCHLSQTVGGGGLVGILYRSSKNVSSTENEAKCEKVKPADSEKEINSVL